jgi:hypothetical protein
MFSENKLSLAIKKHTHTLLYPIINERNLSIHALSAYLNRNEHVKFKLLFVGNIIIFS